MSINKMILLLPLLISISSALECRTCFNFPDAESLEEAQETSYAAVLLLVGNPPVCDDTSQYKECAETQDECQELTVSSKLSGVAMQTGIGGRGRSMPINARAHFTKIITGNKCPFFDLRAKIGKL